MNVCVRAVAAAMRGVTAAVVVSVALPLAAPGTPAPATPAPAPTAPPPTVPASVSPAEDGNIRITPDVPVQGDTLIVLVTARDHTSVTVRFDGTQVPIFAAPDGARRALIGTDPDVATGAHTLRVDVTGDGATPHRVFRKILVESGHFATRSLTLPPQTMGLVSSQNLDIERRALNPVLSLQTPVALWQGPFQAPSTGQMDSPYGFGSLYNGHRMWWHGGVDFADAEGSPIVAANAGIVALAEALPLGGNTVVINHGQGVLTEYLHLSAFTVHKGDPVDRGALIGHMGATGLVTGPSVHWGLFVNGIPVNPLFWVEPRAGLTQ
jgi:murein DD-endopeptidase MepM/ murein hydrolase activator NlpD